MSARAVQESVLVVLLAVCKKTKTNEQLKGSHTAAAKKYSKTITECKLFPTVYLGEQQLVGVAEALSIVITCGP